MCVIQEVGLASQSAEILNFTFDEMDMHTSRDSRSDQSIYQRSGLQAAVGAHWRRA
jgi:hypothetical protein